MNHYRAHRKAALSWQPNRGRPGPAALPTVLRNELQALRWENPHSDPNGAGKLRDNAIIECIRKTASVCTRHARLMQGRKKKAPKTP